MHPTLLLYLGCNHTPRTAGQETMDQCTRCILILRGRFLFLVCIKDHRSSIVALNANEDTSLWRQPYVKQRTMKPTTPPPNPLQTATKYTDPNSAVRSGQMFDCKRKE